MEPLLPAIPNGMAPCGTCDFGWADPPALYCDDCQVVNMGEMIAAYHGRRTLPDEVSPGKPSLGTLPDESAYPPPVQVSFLEGL